MSSDIRWNFEWQNKHGTKKLFRGLLKLLCDNCEKYFYRTPSRDRSEKKFCCRDCYHEWMRKQSSSKRNIY